MGLESRFVGFLHSVGTSEHIGRIGHAGGVPSTDVPVEGGLIEEQLWHIGDESGVYQRWIDFFSEKKVDELIFCLWKVHPLCV